MLGYLSLDIICSSKLTVFLELHSQKTVHFLEQIMSADKYPSIFSCQMEAIVYIYIAVAGCDVDERRHWFGSITLVLLLLTQIPTDILFC